MLGRSVTIDEYEEGFRSTAPSWHQTLMAHLCMPEASGTSGSSRLPQCQARFATLTATAMSYHHSPGHLSGGSAMPGF